MYFYMHSNVRGTKALNDRMLCNKKNNIFHFGLYGTENLLSISDWADVSDA